MRWSCQRGCGSGGTKVYPHQADAARFAACFDLPADSAVGRRAPLVGLLPLRAWRYWKDRGAAGAGAGAGTPGARR